MCDRQHVDSIFNIVSVSHSAVEITVAFTVDTKKAGTMGY